MGKFKKGELIIFRDVEGKRKPVLGRITGSGRKVNKKVYTASCKGKGRVWGYPHQFQKVTVSKNAEVTKDGRISPRGASTKRPKVIVRKPKESEWW